VPSAAAIHCSSAAHDIPEAINPSLQGELATYDSAKQAVLRSGTTGGDNLATHALASVASGFCASVASCPADVVKTRMMSQVLRGVGGRDVG
jgi:hypothetical protein